MKLLQFKTTAAQRVYNEYIKRCEQSIKLLSANDKEECLLEINSHIYEFLEDHKKADETENLLDILDRLGKPEEVLKEVVASRKMTQAIKTYNPKYVFQALFLNIKNGFIYIILFALMLMLITYPILIVLKIIYPKTVGCFVGHHMFFYGFIGFSPNPLVREVLGNWFIPVTILLIAIFYSIIILLLKIVKRKASK